MPKPLTADIAKMRDAARRTAEEGIALSDDVIFPLLAGKSPDLQNAAIAHLLATWVCGHHPKTARGLVLQMHMGLVLELIKITELERGE